MPRRQRGWLRSWRDSRSGGAPAPAQVLAHATSMLANQITLNLQPRPFKLAWLALALASQAPRGLPPLASTLAPLRDCHLSLGDLYGRDPRAKCPSALPCAALPCPALPCAALPCPALPCPWPCPSLPLPAPALPCPALPLPLPCPALPCPCPALPCPALPCPAPPRPALPRPALPCPALPPKP